MGRSATPESRSGAGRILQRIEGTAVVHDLDGERFRFRGQSDLDLIEIVGPAVVDDVESHLLQNQIDSIDQIERPLLGVGEFFHGGRDRIQFFCSGFDLQGQRTAQRPLSLR